MADEVEENRYSAIIESTRRIQDRENIQAGVRYYGGNQSKDIFLSKLEQLTVEVQEAIGMDLDKVTFSSRVLELGQSITRREFVSEPW